MTARNFLSIFLSFLIITKSKCGEIKGMLQDLSDSGSCYSDIQQLIKSKQFSGMLDTWSNFSREFSHGNSFDFGDFDKCMSLNFGSIKPQRCLIQYEYKPTLNFTVIEVVPKSSGINFNWKNMHKRFAGAICIPSSCSAQDVQDIMSGVFRERSFRQTDQYCQMQNTKFEFDALRIISIICLFTTTVLASIGTILTNLKPTTFTVKFFQCFSLVKNFKTLTNFSTSKSTITCINGIKAIFAIIILFAHSIIIPHYYPFTDGNNLQIALNDGKIAHIFGLLSSVIDTFLIISGVLLGRSLLKNIEFNFWKFFIQRYMRLTLLTLFLICYNVVNYSLFKMTSAPKVPADFIIIDYCKEYWWTTALNIQTFVNPKHMCLMHSWYASILFHLMISAAVIHLLMKKIDKTKVFMCYSFVMFCALIIRLYLFTTKVTVYETKLERAMDTTNDISIETYYTIYTRIISFFSGVFLAHIFEHTRDFSPFSNAKLNKFLIKLAFYSSVMFITLFPFIWPLEKSFGIIIGLVWIIATNIVIYACHLDYGGFINDFLSLKLWTPLSKMALSIYLVSLCHQGALTGTRTAPYTTITTNDLIYGFYCDICNAAFPVVLIYTAVECSISNLANLITGKN